MTQTSATARTVQLWDEMTPSSFLPSTTPAPRYDVFVGDTGARCLSTPPPSTDAEIERSFDAYR